MTRWFVLGVFLCGLCSLGGCADNKVATAKVSGTVNLDGKPLEDGELLLLGEAGTVPDSLPIKNGKFEGQAKLGKKKVEVHAFRQGPKAKMGDMEVEGSGKEEIIAEAYNSKTTLSADVTASGINPSKFDVQAR